MRLEDLTAGDRGRVVGLSQGDPVYRQKLLAMGLTPGTEFTVIRFAPLGDPVEIHVRDFDLSLRQTETECLLVERLSPTTSAPATTGKVSPDAVIAVVGNPNSGKTTLFNTLTGARQRVGNWPGVTVEKKTGDYACKGRRVEVVDLPGLYALDVREESAAMDEKIARDFILSGKADLVVAVVDAANLERNLYLVVQLLEMRVPLVVLLNMMDIVEERGFEIDAAKISERLGVPVIPVVATESQGIERLKPVLIRLASDRGVPSHGLHYRESIEAGIERLQSLIQRAVPEQEPRWLALKLLEGDAWAASLLDPETREEIAEQRRLIEQGSSEGADVLIAESRYRCIRDLAGETLRQTGPPRRTLTDALDRIVLNRWLGLPIFFGVMYLLFFFAIQLGRVFKPFFNLLAKTFFVDGFGALLAAWNWPEWTTALLADGLGNGVREVIAFIPIIAFLYVFISLLEDSPAT